MTAQQGLYGGRKVREGTVVSDKMEKTVVVSIQSNIRHPLYRKTIRRERKFMAHDEHETAKMGDVVRIVEAAAVSKRKRWQLVEVLQRAELPEVAPGSIDLDLIGEVKAEKEVAPVAEAAVVVEATAAPETTEAATEEAPAAAESEVPEIEEAAVIEASAAPDATEPEAEPATEEDAK